MELKDEKRFVKDDDDENITEEQNVDTQATEVAEPGPNPEPLPESNDIFQKVDGDEGDQIEESGIEPDDTLSQEPLPVEEEAPERTFTQSQVNAMVGKARKEGRESAMKDLLSRYGVDTEDEMNEVFGRGQAYDYLNDEYETQSKSFQDVNAENALLKSHISENRWDDVKLILNGKGLEVNSENIEMFLPTHPEWIDDGNFNAVNVAPTPVSDGSLENETDSVREGVESMVQPKSASFAPNGNKPVQPATLRKLGHESKAEPDTETEDEKAKKLFGL